MDCPRCGKFALDKHGRCPECGQSGAAAVSTSMIAWGVFLGNLLLVVLALACYAAYHAITK